MTFCLPKEYTKKFISSLKDGTIDPEKMADMTSKERREYLSEIVGEYNAKPVNALFESKLLLKNQQAGMIQWAKQVADLKPEVRRDIISKIEKLDNVLDSGTQDAFLEDLVSKKLGTDITFEEAQKITEFSKEVQQSREAQNGTPEKYLSGNETKTEKIQRLAYGENLRKMSEYLDKINPVMNKNIIANVANIPKTLLSTLDFSAPLRQGWGMMSRGEFYGAFKDMFKYAFSEKAYHQMQADILSRPTYDLMKKGGLRVTSLATKLSQREEAFMSTMLDKVPGIRGSERAYTGFLNKLRADVFDNLLRSADFAGENIKDKKILKDLAAAVNDFTGSGNIGKGDVYSNVVPTLNAGLFSPRKFSATINMFNPERYLNPEISKTARKAALRQLIGSVAMTTSFLYLAKLGGAKVETDPRSSDFGKAVVGKTHYDLTGGNGAYSVLISRLITGKTKSTTTGKFTKLGQGYKPETQTGLVGKFILNKASPIVGLINSVATGKDSMGKKTTIPETTLNAMEPLILQDLQSIIKLDKSQIVPGVAADLFGIGVQTY